ncbi:MAG: carboxypeptidase M32 [Firmicutes bacterium]|nr:carboxypeptidase M32 [Bacillota bacterium]
MTIDKAREDLFKLQKKMSAYYHAMGLISYDGDTTAPKETAANRAVSLTVLSEEVYLLSTGKETVELLEYLDENRESLPHEEQRMVELLIKDIRDMQKIPMEEWIEFQGLLVESQDVWHRAKELSDFEMFRPYLEKVFDTQKRFAGYLAPGKDPYDYWLNEFEDGLSKEICDEFFSKLRARIVPLIAKTKEMPQVDDEIRFGYFPAYKQEELSYYVMEHMGLDLGHVGLSTTEHPFTTSLGSHLDERITTHYHENDFASSMYSVIHEGGHALYDTGSPEAYAYTVLDGGISMGIHESQSRFYENILGRSLAYSSFIFKKLEELFPEEMKGYTAKDLYRAVNKVEPSLIRTEADEVTYSLHVMVRYEIEKAVMAGELEVKDIPSRWNELYKEYLGVDVPDDRQGCLQDSHWSGGAVGYFPSYALGSAYGAQFLSKMKETVDVDGCAERGDFGPINQWNKEHIWKYGCLYKPGKLLDMVLEGPFDPEYYISYLEAKCKDVYGIEE